jgi:hypothetical protein
MYKVVGVTLSNRDGPDVSYQLAIVTETVEDAVRYAGGLMFDRARAGWQVVVVTDDDFTDVHLTALTILGAQTQSPRRLEATIPGLHRSVRTRVQSIDERPADRHSTAAENSEIAPYALRLFWGPHADGGPTGRLHAVRHDLGRAARIFKAHALRMVGLDTQVESSEQFWVSKALEAGLHGDLLPDEPCRHVHAGRVQASAPHLVGESPGG